MTPQISQGWCKIDGHNLPKTRKGFKKANEFQKSAASKKSKFQNGLDEQIQKEVRQKLDARFLLYKDKVRYKKPFQIVQFLIIVTGIIALSLHFYHSFNNYENTIEPSAHAMIVQFEGEKGQTYLNYIQKGKRALVQGRLVDAEKNFKLAEKLYPRGKDALEGLSISLARQCLEKDMKCEEAQEWLKHAWSTYFDNAELLAYLKLIQKKPPV